MRLFQCPIQDARDSGMRHAIHDPTREKAPIPFTVKAGVGPQLRGDENSPDLCGGHDAILTPPPGLLAKEVQ
jgi:hypothetical protein